MKAILLAIVVSFAVGSLAGFAAGIAAKDSHRTERIEFLQHRMQQLEDINKAQADELRRLKDERGE